MSFFIAKMPVQGPDVKLQGLSSEYARGTHIEPHRHAGHQILHARSGVMRVTTAEGSWILPPGRALWVPADCTHEIFCRDAVSMRTVYLMPTVCLMPRQERSPSEEGCASLRLAGNLRRLASVCLDARSDSSSGLRA